MVLSLRGAEGMGDWWGHSVPPKQTHGCRMAALDGACVQAVVHEAFFNSKENIIYKRKISKFQRNIKGCAELR